MVIDSNIGDLQHVVHIFDVAFRIYPIVFLWRVNLLLGQDPGQSTGHSGSYCRHHVV